MTKFLILSFLFSAFILFPKEVAALLPSEPEPVFCELTATTEEAPDIHDYIFANEQFKLEAHFTGKTRENMFFADKSPYKAIIYYALPLLNGTLGDMKLVQSVPNTDERHLNEVDTDECIQYKKTSDDEQICVLYAESLDPGDQKDSWNIEGEDKFKFSIPGPVSVRIYQNDNKTPTEANTQVCKRDFTVVSGKTISVNVGQPLASGAKVIISGKAQNHFKPVSNASVEITIGTRKVKTTTKTDGSYIYDADTTQIWGLAFSNTSYDLTVSTTIDGQKVRGTTKFGVNLSEPITTGTLNTGTNAKLTLNRFYSASTKDYWTTTSDQIPTPSNPLYSIEGSLGQLYKEDDGDGPLKPLYDCLSGNDHFSSLFRDSSCFQATRIGYIYDPGIKQPSGTQPLYQCIHSETKERLATRNQSCKDDPNATTKYTLETTLGYVLDSAPNCKRPTTAIPVKGPVDRHQLYLDKINQAVLYSGVNQTDENNPEIADGAWTGISNDNWLVKKLGLGNFCGSFLTNFLGLGNFCPQPVELGRGTVLFHTKAGSLNRSQVYPRLERDPIPFREDIIQDDDPECEKANRYINESTGWLGDDASVYSVELPKQIIVNDKIGVSTQPVVGGINENVQLSQRGENIESIRVGQYDPNQCAQFQSWYDKSISQPGKGVAPPGFECLPIQIPPP